MKIIFISLLFIIFGQINASPRKYKKSAEPMDTPLEDTDKEDLNEASINIGHNMTASTESMEEDDILNTSKGEQNNELSIDTGHNMIATTKSLEVKEKQNNETLIDIGHNITATNKSLEVKDNYLKTTNETSINIGHNMTATNKSLEVKDDYLKTSNETLNNVGHNITATNKSLEVKEDYFKTTKEDQITKIYILWKEIHDKDSHKTETESSAPSMEEEATLTNTVDIKKESYFSDNSLDDFFMKYCLDETEFPCLNFCILNNFPNGKCEGQAKYHKVCRCSFPEPWDLTGRLIPPAIDTQNVVKADKSEPEEGEDGEKKDSTRHPSGWGNILDSCYVHYFKTYFGK